MRIGYDGKRAANNLTGLGNYSRSLIAQLAQQFPKNEYFVYTPKKRVDIHNLPLFKKENIHVRLPDPKQAKVLNDKIDIFHGLSHEIPVGLKKNGIKSIVTIHDLIFLRKPQYYKLIDRIIYRLKSKYACKHADKIIAISEKTKQDIITFYKTDPAKIEVVYQSCDDSFKTLVTTAEKEKIRGKYKLPSKYLLNVGTIEARKNLLLIIKALPKIDSTYPLVVIGKETSYATLVKKEIEKLGLQDRVIFLQDLPFSDLPSIYQMANIFILPSFYEGFGIPIIEALYGNIPVIAATGSCLEEAGGPSSCYISPNDVQALATTANKIIANETLQALMKQEGLKYVQRFNNDIVSKQLMDCYVSS
jgi:glycosyltransferase involved in cell wall biosynthesis